MYYFEDTSESRAAFNKIMVEYGYATRGEIMDLGNKHLQRMFENCLTIGLDAASKHYEDGRHGGRPSKLTP